MLVGLFDATHIFQGNNTSVHFDFANVGEVCKRLNQELNPNDFVAILHSVLLQGRTAQKDAFLSFGVYKVVLLARLP